MRHIHGLIRNALGDAEREELVHQAERRALTMEEAKRLLAVLKGHRLEALYVCALTVGLRRLHDLRHACATFLLASGASPRTVMKVLGHSQIGLTMNTYAHVLPEIERTAVDDAAERLFGA
ncbi:hypothetical protein GCM10010399_30020 [Dactylosporangium fulvum]|uniref:Tyrosine-type recombinase/integrase n=1 Tax=Dactylosporangium fulvum TaxID=53359 RepID=A0ABY5W1D7_9ACTN|nr:tyrosine-type recombinase/integrase [Dactylosporangium fulvum]UWP83858.1 tyrosine-type recombinase/integrase [Dactylosporangium fulvum]